MTWPTVPIVTTAMDAGTDTPPRDQIKAMADAINDMIATPPSGGAGRLIGFRVYATAGSYTYTPTAGTESIIVTVVGGGGASGGVKATSAGQSALSGSGGGGGKGVAYFIGSIVASSVVVGSGPAGPSSGTAGSSGGNSSFTLSAGTRLLQANGGGGGASPFGSSTFPRAEANGGAGGSVSFAGVSGDRVLEKFDAASAGPCVSHSATFSMVSGGGIPGSSNAGDSYGASFTGKSATFAGCGGKGAANGPSASAQVGYGGVDGMVLIWEYT